MACRVSLFWNKLSFLLAVEAGVIAGNIVVSNGSERVVVSSSTI